MQGRRVWTRTFHWGPGADATADRALKFKRAEGETWSGRTRSGSLLFPKLWPLVGTWEVQAGLKLGTLKEDPCPG